MLGVYFHVMVCQCVSWPSPSIRLAVARGVDGLGWGAQGWEEVRLGTDVSSLARKASQVLKGPLCGFTVLQCPAGWEAAEGGGEDPGSQGTDSHPLLASEPSGRFLYLPPPAP